MELRYRLIGVDDLSAIFEVRVSTVENSITMEQLRERYGITLESAACAIQSDVRGWLCEHDRRTVGFAMGDRSNGEVQVVAVRPEYEGHGIGRTLLELVRDWLFAQGHGEIWLCANPDPAVRAHGFYRRLGWQATGRMSGDDEILVCRQSGN